MTEQQRTARIEFVKKLLNVNGFTSEHKLSFGRINQNKNWYMKELPIGNFIVVFYPNVIELSCYLWGKDCQDIRYSEPLKPIRDFIKLSNQK